MSAEFWMMIVPAMMAGSLVGMLCRGQSSALMPIIKELKVMELEARGR